ncbi:RNA recognition motif domain-containing protein [Wolinella succinogenes]|uniref:RNA recognition motif domain-containing protein n=1 Tax=Wolinella succinogenes TaxID=844 RepID=UPI000F71208D|nr:RNA-binding protein [Wolinella succinogenes]VEG82116.1 splicing factor, CC1-like family [Wolinella succinogenes]
MKSIYVGNMAYNASEQDVRDLFSKYGNVLSVKLVTDRETGKAKGFGFVEMEADGADKAIDALNNSEFLGRNLRVNEAKPREPRDSRPPKRSW